MNSNIAKYNKISSEYMGQLIEWSETLTEDATFAEFRYNHSQHLYLPIAKYSLSSCESLR